MKTPDEIIIKTALKAMWHMGKDDRDYHWPELINVSDADILKLADKYKIRPQDSPRCDLCGEVYCHTCRMHYADCPCDA